MQEGTQAQQFTFNHIVIIGSKHGGIGLLQIFQYVVNCSNRIITALPYRIYQCFHIGLVILMISCISISSA